MKIDVRLRGIENTDSLRDHATRRVHIQLSRFGPEISEVLVRISDLNGPRGGIDKHCRITLRGRRFRELVLDEVSVDPRLAVDAALDRIARLLARELRRVRAVRATRIAVAPPRIVVVGDGA
jgi:putative sigma-54 modulation protein